MKTAIIIGFVGMLLLGGCADQFTVYSFAQRFPKGACTVISADPNGRANLSSMTCLDDEGKIIAQVGGMGESQTAAVMSILGPLVQGAAAGGITAAVQSAVRSGVKVQVQPVAP